MISSVKVVEAGEPALRFWRQQAQLIHSALMYVLSAESGDDVVRVWLGVGTEEARRFEAELLDLVAAANEAYEKRESREAAWVVLPISRAHLVHCVLVTSTRQTGSEEEYNIQVGYFKEHALDLADGVVSALRPAAA